MKRITLLALAGVAFFDLAQPTWAGPHGGGGGFSGGGHFGGGGRVGGFVGGGSRAGPAFYGGGLRAAPAFRGAYFTGRSVSRPSAAPRYYYGRPGMAAARSSGFTASGNRPTPQIAGMTSSIRSQQNRAALPTRQNTPLANSQVTPTNRQPNRTGSMADRNRLSAPGTSTAANRQSFAKNHATERHDANNWHRDWDRHHAHFHNNRVFVFIGGSWWGLYPGDYYSDYASSYPYDYDNSYPYDYYTGNPDSDYDSYPSDYYDQSGYAGSQQSGANTTVSAIQAELGKLGYYNGAIDGVLGDETQAALARYQQDQNISVTGTVNAATLQSLGIR